MVVEAAAAVAWLITSIEGRGLYFYMCLSVCVFVCLLDCSKNYEQILLNFFGGV